MASNSILSSHNESWDLSESDFRAILQANMKFKARSHETHQEVHVPSLTAQLSSNPITTLLIGDSMFERLKTTGLNTHTSKFCSQSNSPTFNAGVGGDKIENVLYRLDLGLLDILSQQKEELKLCVVMIGTNNFNGKKPLKVTDIESYRPLLQALLRIFNAESKILCCEIFKRKDIKDELVEESNRTLRELTADMNAKLGKERVGWIAAPEGIVKERLEDHVHLDEEGYRIWDEILSSRIAPSSK
ncbi:SGNH hydrolase [Acephala macrosclerotiorum]|nr:SGNH hydrolase [Acephala macrosclerotiorum]